MGKYVIKLSHMQRQPRAAPAPRAEALEPVWRALASPIRRRMLDALCDGPLTTGDLAQRFPALTRFAVMQHLAVLTGAELVIVRRAGRRRYNYLNPVPIRQIYDRWVAHYLQPWTEALVCLKSELETEPAPRRRSRR